VGSGFVTSARPHDTFKKGQMTSIASPRPHAGDLLRINSDGTHLRREPSHPRSTREASLVHPNWLGYLNEDDIVIVADVCGSFVNVVCRLGTGWVFEDCISDLFC